MQTKPISKRKPRAIAGETTTKVTPEMKKLAADFHRNNIVANAAKNTAEKARKALYASMKDAGVTKFDLLANIDGKDISIEAEICAKDTTVIDVAALRRIVSAEQFDAIISASKTKVEEVAGKDIAMRVSRTEKGTENVSVKAKK